MKSGLSFSRHCVLFFVLSSLLPAADPRPAFLDIAGFARVTALGGAYTALADEPAGVFANPAGISREGLRFSAADWYLNTQLASGAGSLQLSNLGALSLGINYLSYGSLTGWDEQGNLRGQFSAYSAIAKLAFTRQILDRLALGMAAGYFTEKVAEWQSGGLVLDGGIQTQLSFLRAGLAVRDFHHPRTPFVKALGLAAQPTKPVLLVIDLEHADRVRLRGGGEVLLAPLVLRAGYDGLQPTFGIGLAVGRLTIDYAATVHRRLAIAHQLTLGVNR